MRTAVYPLLMSFPSSLGLIQAVIDRDRWLLTHEGEALFNRLSSGERLDLRRALAAQVELANQTPMKGEPR